MTATAAAGALLLPEQVLAGVSHRSVALRHLHTGERVKATYWIEGAYQPNALKTLNHALRDWRTGEVYRIDPKALDILAALDKSLGGGNRFQIISGYRSPKTNSMLRDNSGGVAKRSYHMRGMAIDIALPEVGVKVLHEKAVALKAGGVGLYTGSGFVHVDTGPVRYWGR